MNIHEHTLTFSSVLHVAIMVQTHRCLRMTAALGTGAKNPCPVFASWNNVLASAMGGAGGLQVQLLTVSSPLPPPHSRLQLHQTGERALTQQIPRFTQTC